MINGNKRIFTNKKNLDKLIRLRIEGMSFLKIAKEFKCDHATVVYQWQKFTGLGKTGGKNNNKTNGGPMGYPKDVQRKRITKDGFCPNCEMRLSGDYHKANPCK